MQTKTRKIRVAVLVLSALLPAGQPVGANLCGDEDRVLVEEGATIETARMKLSATQTDRIVHSLYSVRKQGKLKKLKPCTGVAISPKRILMANHCFEKDEALAFQQHLEPKPAPIPLRKVVRTDETMFDELKRIFHSDAKLIALFEAIQRAEVVPGRMIIDVAIFERVEGEFETYIPPDFDFDFYKLSDVDQFAVAGLPVLGGNKVALDQAKLWFSPATNLVYDDPESFSQRALDEEKLAKKRGYPKVWDRGMDDRPTPRHMPSVVSFCADIFKGNSGSPVIHFKKTGEGWEMVVVAVLSASASKPVADGFPNVAATALSFSWVRELVLAHDQD